MKKLSQKKKQLLKEFVDFHCENCKNKFIDKELIVHRINRGYMGGEYDLRNIKILCLNCHKTFHHGEFIR